MATRGRCLTIHANVGPNKLLSQSTYMLEASKNSKKKKKKLYRNTINVPHEEYKR